MKGLVILKHFHQTKPHVEAQCVKYMKVKHFLGLVRAWKPPDYHSSSLNATIDPLVLVTRAQFETH